MKYFIYIFILLNIYTISYGQQKGQTIYLEKTTKKESNRDILDALAIQKSFTERALLFTQIDSLKVKIKEQGYIDLQTDIEKKNDSTVLVIFDIGNLYKTTKLSLDNNSLLTTYVNKTGFDIEKDSIEIETAFAKAYLKQLSSIAANSGNPFGKFQIVNITKLENELSGTLQLIPGQNRNIDKFVLKGYENFPKGYLKYYARLNTGGSFNQKKLLAQNETLETLPFVTTEKEPEVLFRKDSTIAYYYLKRNNVNRFDGFLGFASKKDNNLRLDGYLDLLLTNNLNYGESLALNYKADGTDQSQLKINVRLPYLLSSPLGIEAEIALFRKDSTFSTSDFSSNIFYTLSPKSTIGVGYTSKTSENLLDNTEESIQDIIDYSSNGVRASYTYTNKQASYFFPIKTNLLVRLGYTERTSAIDKQKQLPIEFSLEHLFQLNNHNALYVRNTTKYISSDSYVTNELFRFGGIQSIRGFEENSLFANVLSVVNTEYRITLNQGLYINSVIDLAYFENAILDQKGKLFSAGIGAGLRTRAGVLKINLANGKFEDLPFEFSNTKLHLILAIRF